MWIRWLNDCARKPSRRVNRWRTGPAWSAPGPGKPEAGSGSPRPSEVHVRAQADHELVPDPLGRGVRVCDPHARIDEVLDIGLNLPRGQDLKLIRRLEKSLARTNGGVDRGL